MQTQQEEQQADAQAFQTLQQKVAQSIDGYFVRLGNDSAVNLYDIFLGEIEEPLLKSVMTHTEGNQSRAAVILGLSRGTLRKKLKQYDLIKNYE